MKTPQLTGILACLVAASAYTQPAHGAGSKIDRVVVFADRAEVTRVTTAKCDAGHARAEFLDLPVQIDERTLNGTAGKGNVVLGTTSDVVHHRVDDGSRTALDEKIIAVEARIGAAGDAQQTLQDERREIDEYAAVLRGVMNEAVRNPKPARQRWGDALDRFKARRLELSKAQVEGAATLRGLHAERSKLHRMLANAGETVETAHRRAFVSVKCGSKRPVRVELNYVIAGARWRPEYDLHFSTTSGRKVGPGRARLTVSAIVQQSTGEDWRGVEIRLSTSKPRLGAEAPVPAPLYVNGHEVKDDTKVLVEARERRSSLKPGGAGGSSAPQAVALEDRGRAFLLEIPHRVDVASDGRPYWIPVDVVAAKATSKLVAVPKLRPYVYQLVTLNNPAPYPLLSGVVHSYRGGRYVGDVRLRYRGLGEPMEVSLGIDEELRVTRESVADRRKKAGLLSSSKRIEHAFEIELSNRASGPQTVELRENIPVSKVDDVAVRIEKRQTTAGFTLDAERGFVTWAVSLGKGETKKLDLAYGIRLPDDWKVQIR